MSTTIGDKFSPKSKVDILNFSNFIYFQILKEILIVK